MPTIDAARWYAAHGWPVFPCRPGTKVPATPHGHKDASTDGHEVVRMFFAAGLDSNVAMPTGVRFDVLDVDRKPEGDRPAVDARPLAEQLARLGLLSGAVGLASTRNDGVHLYFPASGATSGALSEGLDFKALGGYVLLPPSRVPSDFESLPGEYRWRDFPASSSAGAPLDWGAVVRFVRPPAPPAPGPESGHRGSAKALLRTVESATPGRRNHVLYWAACRAAEDGALDGIRDDLVAAAMAAGLPEHEARRTVESAGRTP